MEKKKHSRQTKQISEDFALNKVHQMMNSLLISLHDELKIRNLTFSFTEEQARATGFYIYFFKCLETKKTELQTKLQHLEPIMKQFLCKMIEFCCEVKFSYYLSNAISDLVFTIIVVFSNFNVVQYLKEQIQM